jgi:acetoin:2,6-dichlorophenolindophenol oxidoreductase subunit beta
MRRDERVILFGEDVRASIFGDTRGLYEEFGPERVRDTSICEALITGMAVGAAATGLRVVCHMMFANFLYTGFDAIANQAAKLRYMTGGQIKLPLVFMASCSGGRSSAAQHSDSVHPLFMNLGGLQVATPATPADAKGMLKTAIRSDNPTMYLVAGGRGGAAGEVPEGDHVVPLGKAIIHPGGDDLTLVAIGSMVQPSLQAAETLAGEGLSVEVVDPRWMVPLDEESILRSVAKTGRLMIVDEDYSDFLNQSGEGVHHLLFECNGMSWDEKVQGLEGAGYKCIQSGKWLGKTSFAYFDTSPNVGTLLEIVDIPPDWKRPEPEETYS